MPFPGPAPQALKLYPHKGTNIPEIVILRGPIVRLDLTLAIGSYPIPRIGPTVSTPLIHLRLTAPDSPRVSLQVPPEQPNADITPVGRVHGALQAVWYFDCAGGYDSSLQENIEWAPVASHITPPCSPLLGWHEDVGWLDHSVAQIDWGDQGG
jgi:hypothetical protein